MKQKFNKFSFWTARFWHGMRLRDWLRLVHSHRWRIDFSRWPMAVAITGFSVVNSLGSMIQSAIYSRKIKGIRLGPPPIFIIGHWRSGTTMLHEMMVCDSRFNFPTTYQCFAPSHFLVSQWWATHLLWFLVPKQRPMDNMGAGMKLPQEDEFALMNLGTGSPYRRMAFPNDPPEGTEFLDFQDVPSRDMEFWSQQLTRFAKSLAIAREGRLVFKSPTHTGRIRLLAKLFPGAKFVHISRHPHSLFPSTLRLWEVLDSVQGLQAIRDTPNEGRKREEYVLHCLERMYQDFPRQCESLKENQFLQIRYEDLIQHPLETIQKIYQKLELEDFEAARPALEAYWGERKDYKTNPHPELKEPIREAIRDRWKLYASTYGYKV